MNSNEPSDDQMSRSDTDEGLLAAASHAERVTVAPRSVDGGSQHPAGYVDVAEPSAIDEQAGPAFRRQPGKR
jgi:hypothetical protein